MDSEILHCKNIEDAKLSFRIKNSFSGEIIIKEILIGNKKIYSIAVVSSVIIIRYHESKVSLSSHNQRNILYILYVAYIKDPDPYQRVEYQSF